MNEQRLKEIKERAEKAMSAPWHTNSENEILIENDGRLGKMIRGYEAEFIVHAREDVPALIAEVERLRKALEFYADEGNYKRIMLSILTPKVLFDDGEIARKALDGEPNAI